MPVRNTIRPKAKLFHEGEFDRLFGTLDTKCSEGVPDASSGDGVIRTWEQCQEWAESYNCIVKVAKDNELFIDIDTEERFNLFEAMQHILCKYFPVTGILISPSKQGLPHRHIVVTLDNDYGLGHRIALQAALGSDSMRELLSIRRACYQEENVVIFFEPK